MLGVDQRIPCSSRSFPGPSLHCACAAALPIFLECSVAQEATFGVEISETHQRANVGREDGSPTLWSSPPKFHFKVAETQWKYVIYIMTLNVVLVLKCRLTYIRSKYTRQTKTIKLQANGWWARHRTTRVKKKTQMSTQGRKKQWKTRFDDFHYRSTEQSTAVPILAAISTRLHVERQKKGSEVRWRVLSILK